MANVGMEIRQALRRKGQWEEDPDLTLRDKAQTLEDLGRITKAMTGLRPEALALTKLEELGMVAEIGWGRGMEIEFSETESGGRVGVLCLTPFIDYWLVIRPVAICYESIWQGFESVGKISISELAESLSQ